MTRTTEPTTKAERDKWKAQPILIDRTIIQRLLDDADDLDALLQKLTDLESRLEHVKKLRQEQINALQAVHHEYIVDFAGMLAHRGLQAEADLVMENTAPLLQRIATIVSGLVGDRDALRRRVAVLVSALEKLKHGDGCYCDASFASPGCHPRHSSECEFAMAALSASPPAPPDPNADKVTCRRCGIKVDASECVGESADPDSEPVCYGCQFTLLIDERDRFQRLAKFYDAQIRENVAKTIVEREPDGSPCWAGRAPTLHLIRVCDEHVKFAEIVRRLEEWWRMSGCWADRPISKDDALKSIASDAAALRAGAGGKP